MIRPLRATDVLAFALRRGGTRLSELTAATWPKAAPESREPGFFDLLRHGLVPTPRAHPIGVAATDHQVDGFIVGVGRAGGLVWDVEYLRADDAETGAELLRWVCERAVEAGARRLFIETSSAGTGAEVARRAGFEPYSRGEMLRLDPGFSRLDEDSLPARPRLRSDESGLFQLYNAAVPASVRVAEAMTHEEWAALYRGPKLWAPRLIGNRQDYVWELGTRVAGWMRVVFGDRCQLLELLVHPLYEAYADKMVGNALVQMSNKAAVLADVREYQSAAGAALQRAGFRPIDSYVVWVRQLAKRVAEPAPQPVRAPASPPV